jgi:hypothetical protein
MPNKAHSTQPCMCPITLFFYDFHALSNHFNLLLPLGNCCDDPQPSNSVNSIDLETIDLETQNRKSYASALKNSLPAVSSMSSVKQPYIPPKSTSMNQTNTTNTNVKQPGFKSPTSTNMHQNNHTNTNVKHPGFKRCVK